MLTPSQKYFLNSSNEKFSYSNISNLSENSQHFSNQKK
jgi:hypothetical protein